jgi:ABC-type nitrate/sulfonate/bicarbonate transport system substrate-binding protein
MKTGIVQARAFNPDAAFLLKKQGFTELAVLADLGPWPWAGYSTSDAHLTNSRDKLKRWTRAMVKSLQFMLSRKEETYKIAAAEFGHPSDVTQAAADVCIKAIDPQNPGGVTEDSMRKNIDLTITAPLRLKASPSLSQLVDFSLLREVQKELSAAKNDEAGALGRQFTVFSFSVLRPYENAPQACAEQFRGSTAAFFTLCCA